jgi:hypothetical protein
MNGARISDLAEAVGVATSTVRYYELADERLGVLLTELASIAVAEHCDYCDGRQRARA